MTNNDQHVREVLNIPANERPPLPDNELPKPRPVTQVAQGVGIGILLASLVLAVVFLVAPSIQFVSARPQPIRVESAAILETIAQLFNNVWPVFTIIAGTAVVLLLAGMVVKYSIRMMR